MQLKENLKYDIPAGIAVFFVAVPLCLGIAHASGVPIISGLITGIIGGLIVGFVSKSALSISGPAAGLTAIALSGISTLGSFEAFLLATIIAGLIQITLGVCKAGSIATYIPTMVIRGMLSAIGLILIIKQFPHMIGYDIEEMGVEQFVITKLDMDELYEESKSVEENTFTIFFHAISNLNLGVLFIGLASLLFLVVWERFFQKKYKMIRGPLLVVLMGIAISYVMQHILLIFSLHAEHFVRIPTIRSFDEFTYALPAPDWSMLSEYKLYLVAFTIAIVASVEALLSVEAIDKLDSHKRKTPVNHELIAQGVGNTLAGLFGGLPLTSVIIRGSVNLSAGARSKISAMVHGFLLLISIFFLSRYINLIPLASLAAVLVYTGYRLIQPHRFLELYRKGWKQFLPYIVTVVAIVLSDLLIGVIIGIVVSMILITIESYRSKVIQLVDNGPRKRIVLGEHVSFVHKPQLVRLLNSMPEGAVVEVDGSRNLFLDQDCLQTLIEFKETAKQRHIEFLTGGIKMDNNKKALKENMRASYERLFINNRKWVEERLSLDPEYFKKLTQGQTPQYLFIGCSDSRVPANEITGTEPGEMFVQRNIANMVVNTDVNLMSVLQYSIEVLNVKHVIVCGHYGCGGIRAAMDDSSHGLLDRWLSNIKDVYRLHQPEVDAITDHELKHRKMVELNVREQVYNLMKTAIVQKNRELYGFPEVHGWIYDIADGKLVDLQVDVDKEFPEFKDVYKIH